MLGSGASTQTLKAQLRELFRKEADAAGCEAGALRFFWSPAAATAVLYEDERGRIDTELNLAGLTAVAYLNSTSPSYSVTSSLLRVERLLRTQPERCRRSPGLTAVTDRDGGLATLPALCEGWMSTASPLAGGYLIRLLAITQYANDLPLSERECRNRHESLSDTLPEIACYWFGFSFAENRRLSICGASVADMKELNWNA